MKGEKEERKKTNIYDYIMKKINLIYQMQNEKKMFEGCHPR